MKAIVWHDIGKISLDNVSDPKMKEPYDAIVRLTASAICGTDLHMYDGRIGAEPGLVLGHEPLGVVRAVGEDVHLVRLVLVLSRRILFAVRRR